MSTRLPTGGRLLDRGTRLRFRFNGREMQGLAGDTLASALMADGQMLMGRSFKYHRPRGAVAAGSEEPNALMGVGEGGRFEPNQRATTQELFDGLVAESQNHWPSLEMDVGAASARLSRLLPAGFYYKTFMGPRPFWKHVYEPLIRRSAGLGKAPTKADADRYEHFHAFCDVLIAGGGVAGLTAALAAGSAGARVLLVEQGTHWGGRTVVDGGTIDSDPAEVWVQAAVARLSKMPNVTLRLRTMAAAVHDHGYVLANENLTDHRPGAKGPRHRLWRIRAGRIVTATGAIERPLSFAGNDLPGVMLAAAVRDFAVNWAVSPGDRTVIVINNDDAYRTALALTDAGLSVPAILDARPGGGGALAAEARSRGLRIETGRGIARVLGRRRVTGVEVCAQAGEGAVLDRVECDAVAMSGGWSPAVHLWSHCGGKLLWDDGRAHFRPDPDRAPIGRDGAPNVLTAGSVSGPPDLAGCLADAAAAGARAAREAGAGGTAEAAPTAAPEVGTVAVMQVWMMPQGAGRKLREKAFLDFQNDVKVSDVMLAAQEGFESVEHAKRYTTLGMATDQGKLSNINGLAVLSQARGTPIPEVGTTTFRPPFVPIPMGAVAGEARGAVFQPLRCTPMHDWHAAHGADWEPVGQWRRPYCYPRAGEDRPAAVAREIGQTRRALGLLDASTLGKIVVTGPDAGRFLDMLYTNMMSTLKPGRCRYGLMCSENGFLVDDGVVARWDDRTFLCHTTTGGAERIHAHMEEWLQTEWWDWQVYTANVTEQYAQIGVVGPQARTLLQSLGATGMGGEEFPFMAWQDREVAGIRARVYRISFSGELSYELAVPASQGLALWETLMEAGAAYDAMPYGTEALHVMRAEKGFIMIGDETDGTVIPQDLGLHWAISKKKDDYLGKRAQQRPHMTDPDRWQLVGLETHDGSVLPHGALALGDGLNANGQAITQGRVTSSYHSPTLGRGIALGLVHRGPDRTGEEIAFATLAGDRIRTRIVGPVFHDKAGEKQNV